MNKLPSGTFTFLFTNMESSKLAQSYLDPFLVLVAQQLGLARK
jgi:hypothetical protein